MGSAASMLMQTGNDIARFFKHAPNPVCRIGNHCCIALSGEASADLNMLILANGATRADLAEGLTHIRGRGLDAIMLVEEGADDLRTWASDEGLMEVGQMPLMERRAAPVGPLPDFTVRMARRDEMKQVSRLAAEAFSLDATACENAMPASIVGDDDIDLWVVEERGLLLGCGAFVRTGAHVGIYVMSTPQANQRRGIGRAVLTMAMDHYQRAGAERFTLGATEVGYPLYERVGFTVRSRPHVFLVGSSTQFPGH